ncbi:hypothetical protein Bca4012_009730 [Brassica carinata]
MLRMALANAGTSENKRAIQACCVDSIEGTSDNKSAIRACCVDSIEGTSGANKDLDALTQAIHSFNQDGNETKAY